MSRLILYRGIEQNKSKNDFVCPGILVDPVEYRVVCPNVGHHILTSVFTKYRFLQVKNGFAKIKNRLLGLKLFQLSNGDYHFRIMRLHTKCGNIE